MGCTSHDFTRILIPHVIYKSTIVYASFCTFVLQFSLQRNCAPELTAQFRCTVNVVTCLSKFHLFFDINLDILHHYIKRIMPLLTIQLPVLLSFMTYICAFLLEMDNVTKHTTTPGPLGKDDTLSLLVQEVLDLKSRVKSQEREIQMMKNQQVSNDNVINTTVRKMDSMATSIRYLTLSLQGHEIHNEETNMTVYKELYRINSKLLDLGNLSNSKNEILMSGLQLLTKRIDNLTFTETLDIQKQKIEVAGKLTGIYSDIRSIQIEVREVYRTIHQTGNCLFMFFLSWLIYLFFYLIHTWWLTQKHLFIRKISTMQSEWQLVSSL